MVHERRPACEASRDARHAARHRAQHAPLPDEPQSPQSPQSTLPLQAHWAVPENLFGVLPYVWVAYSRAADFSLPTFYDRVRV